MKVIKCKEVPGYEGRYLLYSDGRVYSVERTYKNHGKLTKVGGYYLNKVLLKIGYYTVALTRERKTTLHYLHRLLGEAFIPNPNNYPQINHKDGNKTNNDLSNLEWCTIKQNTQHAVTNGIRRIASGEKIHTHKLTEGDVQKIRVSDTSTGELAKIFGVSRDSIYKIKKRINWKHLEEPKIIMD